ncbi:epidermal growth factor-like protein [Episyrphus balteatus]|uniref:epidermal growth factor-like protein n=1 Tax=Episyrphus balteatus TaxID=286459 RepID=UPI0024856D14|nr:epidermal growth factor-like protein [Episyrphus balteatus]
MFQRIRIFLMCAGFISFSVVVLSEREISGDIFTSETRSLSYNVNKIYRNKCSRQVPAVLFRTERNELIQGNGTTIHFHQIEDCCDGYKRTRYDWNRCEPDCGTKCKNGFCTSPGQCDCFDGFTKNDRGECVFACPLGCENGRCFLNGTCRCNDGHTLDPTRTFCRPHCRPACGHNQICVETNKCECRDGYQMTAIGCQPICTPDCGHGRCYAPNKCECFAGFGMRLPRTVCEAECYMICENGFCDSRYRCQCYDGFRYDENTTSCLPDCGDKCENGVCKQPGVCHCFEGFELKDNTCVPKCEHGCGYYGKCVAPNVCGCGLSNQQCSFGNCDAFGKCVCGEGLVRFVDKCVAPNRMESLVSSYEQRSIYNQQLRLEFNNLIGRHFGDLYSF